MRSCKLYTVGIFFFENVQVVWSSPFEFNVRRKSFRDLEVCVSLICDCVNLISVEFGGYCLSGSLEVAPQRRFRKIWQIFLRYCHFHFHSGLMPSMITY